MLTLNFHSFKERLPEHGHAIILLRFPGSGDFFEFRPIETKCEFMWVELFNEVETGVFTCFDPEDPEQPKELDVDGGRLTHVLQLFVDGMTPEDDWFWCDVDDMWMECIDALHKARPDKD